MIAARASIMLAIAAIVLAAPALWGADASAQQAATTKTDVAKTDAKKAVPTPFQTEIIVRTARNLRNQAEVTALVDMAARYEVTVINVAAKQDEDDEMPSGVVFYTSRIAPRAPGYRGFDVLKAVIEAAHKRGIKVRAWVPQFHDQIAAIRNPGWQMQIRTSERTKPYFGGQNKEYFVNPLDAAVQDYQRSIIAEIARNYDVDGIVLDWLRFDGYNMDMGAETRARFKAEIGYDPADVDFAADSRQRSEWNAWRTAQIARYVESARQAVDAIKPGLGIGVYILPPEFVEVGQDAGQFSQHVNFLAPMVYFEDWGYPLSWVQTNVLPQTRKQAKGTSVIPAMSLEWSDAAYDEILGHMRQEFPEISTLSWFVYGAWTEEVFERISKLRVR